MGVFHPNSASREVCGRVSVSNNRCAPTSCRRRRRNSMGKKRPGIADPFSDDPRVEPPRTTEGGKWESHRAWADRRSRHTPKVGVRSEPVANSGRRSRGRVHDRPATGSFSGQNDPMERNTGIDFASTEYRAVQPPERFYACAISAADPSEEKCLRTAAWRVARSRAPRSARARSEHSAWGLALPFGSHGWGGGGRGAVRR